jgi:hypothetical protein
MAQHQTDNRYKHRKGIPISPNSRNNKMTTNNATTSHSPHRSTPKADRKDHQQSDTASVASTVKISNVATPSPLPKTTNNDGQSMMKSVRPSKINSILDSRDDNQYNGTKSSLYKHTEGYQRDSLLAPTSSTTAKDDATIVCKGTPNSSIDKSQIILWSKLIHRSFHHFLPTEIFLLLTLEGLSANDYLRIMNDQTFIHPKLQLLLAGDQNQPITNSHLRLFWNDLTIDDYRQISNSFFHHMRFTVKRTRQFNIQTIKRFFHSYRLPCRRTSATDVDQHSNKDSTIPSSISHTVSRPTSSSSSSEESHPNNDESGIVAVLVADTTSALRNQVQPRATVENDSHQVSPAYTSLVSNLEQEAQITTTTSATSLSSDDHNGIDVISIAPPPMTISREQKQEQDPILILLDIVDNASVNSSSTNGYATSMTSSIGSSSNMSRSYRQYNGVENRFHQRIPGNNNHQHYSAHNTPTNSVSSISATTSTSTSFSNTSSNVIDSYNQKKQRHHHHQYDMDNDSTTSSNTGYISTMSNGHISISGSVASV